MIRWWFKKWFWYFLSAFSKPISVRITSYGQLIDKEHRINKITLSDRREEKAALMAEWIKPENIALRREKHEKEAAEYLAKYGVEQDPIPENLPDWLKNQSPSFIRRALKNGFTPVDQ